MFGTLSAVTPQHTARLGYWLFRHPSAFNYATPEEKALVANTASTFSKAKPLLHDGSAGQTPLWRWPDPPEDGSQCRKVLLLHGWGGQAGLMGAFVGPLTTAGYQVLIPDLPGQGSAHGRLVDTRTSVSTILELNHSFGPFHSIIGHSLGGLLACMVAAGHDTFDSKTDVSKLVTINSPVSLGAVVTGLGKAIGLAPGVIDQVSQLAEYDLGFPLKDTHAQALLDRANVPTFAFHDVDDPFIPHAGSLARLAQHAQMEAHATTGFGHISVLADETVIAQVVEFLGRP